MDAKTLLSASGRFGPISKMLTHPAYRLLPKSPEAFYLNKMENTITILMSVKDADMVEKIFNRTQEPNFTIVNKFQFEEHLNSIYMTFWFECSLHLWYLAKEVQSMHNFEEKCKEIIDAAEKKIDNNLKAIKDELNKLG